MAIQKKDHEVTVAMMQRINDFYDDCVRKMSSAEAVKCCQERFCVEEAYVGQARKVMQRLSHPQSNCQTICQLLNDQRISADTFLTVAQCAEANGRNIDLDGFLEEVLNDLDIPVSLNSLDIPIPKKKRRLSKGQFKKWREEKESRGELKKGR